MSAAPIPNGSDGGRDTLGRFLPGNAGGPGYPFAGRVARFRAALIEAVTEDDLRAVVEELVRQAKAGEPWAVREVLDRLLGRPEAVDLLVRIEALEAALGAVRGER